ncbi:MAG: LysR family transcriptional regulator, partial [Phascolarctobacterium sp.]|nr:LysR family transcriptional regulator [Phascolarctobacterium sp.]
MEFKQLQSFVSVVQRKSFTKAAEELYLSQPTISTHIYQLEEELHTKLILRTTKSITITPKGMELYNYATNILELKQRMLQACSVESKRIIHLGASTIPSAYILPQLLPEFGKLHADIYFVMHQSDSQGIIDGLKDGLFNIGFIGMPCQDEEIACQPFCEDRLVLITPVQERFLALAEAAEPPLAQL